MIYGTSCFPSLIDAISYFDDYGLSALDVEQKIADKSITIGKPSLKYGDHLFVKRESSYLGNDGKPVPTYRYFIKTSDPVLSALDNLCGPGSQYEYECDEAEHDEESGCVWCCARKALKSYKLKG